MYTSPSSSTSSSSCSGLDTKNTIREKQNGDKYTLLKDITICGVTTEKGTVYNNTHPNYIEDGIFYMCAGHGHFHELKIGIDCEKL